MISFICNEVNNIVLWLATYFFTHTATCSLVSRNMLQVCYITIIKTHESIKSINHNYAYRQLRLRQATVGLHAIIMSGWNISRSRWHELRHRSRLAAAAASRFLSVEEPAHIATSCYMTLSVWKTNKSTDTQLHTWKFDKNYFIQYSLHATWCHAIIEGAVENW